MIEVQILIPTNENSGQTFAPNHDAAFESELLRLFGGCSLLPGTVAGQWVDAGTIYTDQSRVYAVALKSLTEGNKVREATEFAKIHYGQLAIYVRYLGLSEVL